MANIQVFRRIGQTTPFDQGVQHARKVLMLTRDLYLPTDYNEREGPARTGDKPGARSASVGQPEIYPVALILLAGTHRRRLVDVGCGTGMKLADAIVGAKLGIDSAANIAQCRSDYTGRAEWLELDFDVPIPAHLVESIGPDDVVICGNVLEHLPDPRFVLAFLSSCFQRGALIVTTTPERVLLRGADHAGPPLDAARIREWAIAEYRALLLQSGLPPFYIGLTLDDALDRQLRTIISIHEPRLQRQNHASTTRPLAILSSFNEEDIIDEVIEHWIAQACDVHVLDNWSTDRTWSILTAAGQRFGRHLTIERFPPVEPVHGSWHDILSRKEDIAFGHPGRWIIHTDADEIRSSPFSAFNLADALHHAELANWNRINFTVLNHRPVDDRRYLPGSLNNALLNFEFGTKPGHFIQKKAWLQGASKVSLANSGGHVAEFEGARDCPYHFVLHHYPLRSVEHGRRKINRERGDRWSTQELAMGWHSHYQDLAGDANLVWDAAALHHTADDFWARHGLRIVTGLQR